MKSVPGLWVAMSTKCVRCGSTSLEAGHLADMPARFIADTNGRPLERLRGISLSARICRECGLVELMGDPKKLGRDETTGSG